MNQFLNGILSLASGLYRETLYFCRTILCVLGVLLLLGTCFDVIRNHRRQLLIVNSDTEHDQDDDDDDDSLLDDDAEQGDQHDIVVQSLGTNGMSSETLMTFPPKQNQPRGCAFPRLTLKALGSKVFFTAKILLSVVLDRNAFQIKS